MSAFFFYDCRSASFAGSSLRDILGSGILRVALLVLVIIAVFGDGLLFFYQYQPLPVYSPFLFQKMRSSTFALLSGLALARAGVSRESCRPYAHGNS